MKWTETIKTLEEYKDFIEKTAIDEMPTDWRLRKNIVFNLQVNDTVFEITFKAPKYWYYAERGRLDPEKKESPGKWPPFKKIEDWIIRRRITPYPLPSGEIPTRKQLTFLISRKIGLKGTEEHAKHFINKAITKNEIYWEERIKDALTLDIEAEIGEWLSPLSGVTSI